MRKPIALVLYYSRGVFPLRDTIKKHLYSWQNYSRFNSIYLNVALGFPDRFFETHQFDIIIYHTSLCGIRWGDAPFYRFKNLLEPLSNSDAYKIAIPQDEFVHTGRLVELLNFWGVDLVLSCAEESEWSKIYKGLNNNPRIVTVLTGYLDTKSIKRISSFAKPMQDRKNFVVYRAWRAAYWLGEHGQLKVQVGQFAKEACDRLGLTHDISLNDSDTISGEDWFRFLADSRATVGVEGGASIIDVDGAIKKAVEKYLEANPEATFEDTRRAVFNESEGSLDLRAVSPRHLEAVAVRCCQLLIEGHYNGILEAGKHYIPIAPDFSNLDDALKKLNDTDYIEDMVDTAYAELIDDDQYSYPRFVSRIESIFADERKPNAINRPGPYWLLLFRIRDILVWIGIRLECRSLRDHQAFISRAVSRTIFWAAYSLPKF